MRVCDLILRKRNGDELSAQEIESLINGYTRGEVPDYQMAAWLMAVWFRGLSPEETSALTMSMVRSGRTLDLSCIPGVKVDKHSTGGVGDKTTLVLCPLLAAAGAPVAKMSGRSLGHTGGTLDKLESIPGFSTALTPEQMVEQVKRIGITLAGQTVDLAPADKKLYSLRDLTATVDSTPLIAASVMSKKIASGADAIVLDVKAGSGAFMKTVEEATELAQAMVEIGKQVGRRTVAAVTNMDQPLGQAVGNVLEVEEAINTLRGDGPDDLAELCVALAGIALTLAGKASSREEGEDQARNLLDSGGAAEKFRQLVEAQGGDPRVVDDTCLLPRSPVVRLVKSHESGYVTALDALKVASAATLLGAGRGVAGVEPDPAVGVRLLRKTGEKVSEGEPLAELHARDAGLARAAEEALLSAYSIASSPPPIRALVGRVVE